MADFINGITKVMLSIFCINILNFSQSNDN